MTRANMTRADMTDANMTGADMTRANLTGAYLTGADMTGANMTRANMTRADMTGADMTDANMTGADMTGADLTGAYLTRADLTAIRDDLWSVLSAAPCEVSGLRLALAEGRVDGSQYQGSCACLIGTIANLRGCVYRCMGKLQPNAERPSERFFLAILPGSTPSTSQHAKLAVEWIDQWLDNIKSAVAAGAL
jgi:uncharacterized protein YjbI with pentapeptide repeats